MSLAPLIDTPLIDTHVHFDSERFDHDRDAVFKRAVANNITGLIIPAVSRIRWSNVTEVTTRYPGTFASYGLHPVFIHEHNKSDLEQLEKTILQKSCFAIGECGLDGTCTEQEQTLQREYFDAQLQIARQHKLPVIIHARQAVEEVILALRNNGPGKGVVHSYNGSLQQAHRLIDLGYHMSFGGPVTYERARKLHSLVRQLPLNSLMIETDAPDQTGAAHQGQRNEPAYLREVLAAIATLRNEEEVVVADASNRNAEEVFALPK